MLTRAVVLHGPTIGAEGIRFSPWVFDGDQPATPGTGERSRDALKVAEIRVLQDALRRHKGNRSAVARELGLARSTLHYKLARYELDGREGS